MKSNSSGNDKQIHFGDDSRKDGRPDDSGIEICSGVKINHSVGFTEDVATTCQEEHVRQQISPANTTGIKMDRKENKRNERLNKGDRVTTTKSSKNRSSKSKRASERFIHGNNSNNAEVKPSEPGTKSDEIKTSHDLSTGTAKSTDVRKSKKSLNLSATSNTSNRNVKHHEVFSRSDKKRIAVRRNMMVRASMSPLSKSIAINSPNKDMIDAEMVISLVTQNDRHRRSPGGTHRGTKETKSKQKEHVRHEGATSVSPAQMQLLDHNVNRFSTAAAIPLFPDGSRLSTDNETEI